MALNRQRVLDAAVTLADEIGLDALSMRRLAQELGVVPMALYKHVANREQLIDGMVDVLIGEIGRPSPGLEWKAAVREQVLESRRALQRHPWAREAIESRIGKTPAVLGYLDSVIGIFLAGGFSTELTHHVMHAFGSRVWGLTQEVFDDPPGPQPVPDAATIEYMASVYPNVLRMAMAAEHDSGSTVGSGCDDQFEFEFALDVLLDGFELLQQRQWSRSTG